eukprot:UN15466
MRAKLPRVLPISHIHASQLFVTLCASMGVRAVVNYLQNYNVIAAITKLVFSFKI